MSYVLEILLSPTYLSLKQNVLTYSYTPLLYQCLNSLGILVWIHRVMNSKPFLTAKLASSSDEQLPLALVKNFKFNVTFNQELPKLIFQNLPKTTNLGTIPLPVIPEFGEIEWNFAHFGSLYWEGEGRGEKCVTWNCVFLPFPPLPPRLTFWQMFLHSLEEAY